MYAQFASTAGETSGSFSSDSFGDLPTPDSQTQVGAAPGLVLLPHPELDYSVSEDSPSSLASCHGGVSSGCSLMQRSVSISSGFYGQYLASCGDTSPVRRAFSAGDLHTHRGESPVWSESNAIIEGMNRACPYSPEEKKERIERYRSKRNLRNFNKRIKYECRKTLADSRPRIRGRFARNEEIEKNTQMLQWNQTAGNEDEEAWIELIDSYSASQFLNL